MKTKYSRLLPQSVSDYDTVFRQMLERVFPVKIDGYGEDVKQLEDDEILKEMKNENNKNTDECH